tara:strand:- start:2944 stop:3378 length:435 start_codon:yes stop_codon:yes gene_type:complete
MPNWCENKVNIYGIEEGSQEEIKHFLETCFVDGELDFEKIIPYPDSAPSREDQPEDFVERMNHPFARWYNNFGYFWCVENWGTKWGATQQDNDLSSYPDEIELRFDTAWSPPQGIHDKVQEMLPNCSISWFYKEEGMRVSGWLE